MTNQITNQIYISIASFRDPELIPTLHSMIENADNPENLKICIAWQNGDADFEIGQLDEYKDDPRFIIIDIPFLDSLGACWARSEIQKRYDNEEWFLQIDSHMRFVPHWDTISIEMIKELKNSGYKKPLLTSYVPSYDPDNEPAGRSPECWRLDWDRFIPESPFFMLPAGMTEEELKTPLLSRFFSAHFVFVEGLFVKDVPYDPNLFFHGEEGSLAVRAWTWGYDLFAPNKQICFHEYTRNNREGLKVWDKNKNWGDLNSASHLRHRKLFEMDGEKKDIDFEIYDFGKERTLEDYERFSGIQFKTRAVQQWTLDHKPPPNPEIYNTEEEYQNSFQKIFRHCLDVWDQSVPETDYQFWAIIFKDKDDKEIYRKDIQELEILDLKFKVNNQGFLNIWSQFHTEERPKTWIVWPYRKNFGWVESPISGQL